MTASASDPAALLQRELLGPVWHLRLNRPAKRNALNDALIAALHDAFAQPPTQARVAVISAAGEHFCAGLDLSELAERSVFEGVEHARMWHAAFDRIQFGRLPVVVALHGAVVGGGLELAAAAHIRVADATAFYALPEGKRGLFVGGGGSARLPRLIGYARMTDMMLTGRVLDAQEGQACGVSQYLVEAGQAISKALELAQRIAENAPLTNYAVIQALPRIAQLSQPDGLFMEALMAAISQGDEAAKQRMRDFLEGRGEKVRKAS
ncbi:MAG: crotonase/enoyl-CoA hydratase family protein [Sutterellaceae bacterium]|nr:crotonase/enoyl-CoA hydratase family protein [Burkholderiaceae bacterium]MDW8430315.1 crotonase/enoyl-CoA hydratase family protein [Sutterellaceae bacterium]